MDPEQDIERFQERKRSFLEVGIQSTCGDGKRSKLSKHVEGRVGAKKRENIGIARITRASWGPPQ